MPRANLNRDRIVEAALELVEESGTAGLSMRALARRLGVDPMAVYRHVRDKAELLGAMCDATIAGLPPIDPGGDWEPQIRQLVRELRRVLLARPALVPVLLEAPATPAAAAVAHRSIELLTAWGLDEREAVEVFGAVFAYALGAISIEISGPAAADPAGLREETSALIAGGAHLDAALELMQDTSFNERGIDLLLDGVRTLIRERSPGGG